MNCRDFIRRHPMSAAYVLASFLAVEPVLSPAQQASESGPGYSYYTDLFNEAGKQYLNRELTNAYRTFQNVVAINPGAYFDTYNAEWMMGRIQERWGNLNEAVAHFERSL